MRIFSWDYILCMLTLFALMFIFPLLFSFEILSPMVLSLADFRITDIIDSKMVERDQLQADTNMILINTVIENEEISNFGLAKLVNVINSYEPKVIAIKDIIEKSDNQKQDMILASVLSRSKNLVMAAKLEKFDDDNEEFKSIKKSDEMFLENASIGFDNLLNVKDERIYTIRTFMPFANVKNEKYTSLSTKILELYSPEKYKELLKRGNENEQIHYLGNYQFFRMEAMDVLDQNFEPELIKNKIIILGRISTKDAIDSNMALKDVYFTPLNDSYTGKSFPDMYGTVLHANIISMILNGKYFGTMPGWMILLVAALFVYTNMVIFTYIIIKNKKWYEIISLGVFVVESVFILAITIICFVNFNYEMNLTIPIFSIAMSIIVYEIYNSSLKPLTIKMYYKFIHKG